MDMVKWATLVVAVLVFGFVSSSVSLAAFAPGDNYLFACGSKSPIGTYATNFTQNAELHESKDGDELIPGLQAFATPVKKECMSSYTFSFMTFTKIGYVVSINAYRVGQWMADDYNKNKIITYSTIFATNACLYVLQDGLIPGGVGDAIFIILSNSLIDVLREYNKPSKEKAGSPRKHFIENLKDEVGMKFFFNEFIAFMRYASRVISKDEVLTKESMVFMMKEFFVFRMKRMKRNGTQLLRTMKRQFGTQFLSQKGEIIVAVMRELLGMGFVNDLGFHEPSTKGMKKKGKLNITLTRVINLYNTGVRFTCTLKIRKGNSY